jgi:hypothetical protein
MLANELNCILLLDFEFTLATQYLYAWKSAIGKSDEFYLELLVYFTLVLLYVPFFDN